ncbi:MAG: alanine--glyoxylate aminotransferase family protein [Alphaproteobacteria bacterium]|nr:alanine--glyoxylate aminotransferase family protein [Alphaproteobacteria bacterium]
MTMLTPFPTQPLAARLPRTLPLLMGVGPTPIPEPVQRAHGLLINHLGPTMNGVVEAVQEMARYVFQTESRRVFGISGPGSAAMEMAMANLLWPGRRALVVVNGTFSARLAELGRRAGAEVAVLELEPGTGIDPAALAEVLDAQPADLVAMGQGETSCGAYHQRLPEAIAVAKARGALVVVDTVVTLSCMPFLADEWGVDVALTAGQKGLGSVPGVSLIAFNEASWAAVCARPAPPAQWVLDARLAERFWMDHQYHYTAPTPSLLAMYEALRLICEEGLEARWARHAAHSGALQAGLEALGLTLFAAPEHRLASAVAVRVPDGVDVDALRARMEDRHGVQIAGAFGLPIFRIGQLGEQCRRVPVLRTLSALGEGLVAQGYGEDAEAGARVAAELLGA